MKRNIHNKSVPPEPLSVSPAATDMAWESNTSVASRKAQLQTHCDFITAPYTELIVPTLIDGLDLRLSWRAPTTSKFQIVLKIHLALNNNQLRP